MIKVLVVDDSEVVCRILSKEISKAPDMQVVGTAADPYLARDMIVELRPDVITLDLEMPRMNGLTFLGKLMRHYPLPVIVVSSQTPQGSDMALKALEMGAVEVLGKPGPEQSVTEMGETLVEKIRAAAATRAAGTRRPPSPGLSFPGHSQMPCDTTYQVLAMGASTGGAEAIKQVLAGMPSNCPGIVIAQHMSELFTAQFAKRLNESCTLEVREAAHGDELVAGLALSRPAIGIRCSAAGDRNTLWNQERTCHPSPPTQHRRALPLGGGCRWQRGGGRPDDRHGRGRSCGLLAMCEPAPEPLPKMKKAARFSACPKRRSAWKLWKRWFLNAHGTDDYPDDRKGRQPHDDRDEPRCEINMSTVPDRDNAFRDGVEAEIAPPGKPKFWLRGLEAAIGG